MRILQLCKKFPYPPKDGEAIAIMNLVKAFHFLNVESYVLCMNTPKHFFPPDQLPASIREIANFDAVKVDTTFSYWKALSSLNSKIPYIIRRFISEAFKAKLIKTLIKCNFDVIQCEGVFLSPYLDVIRRYTKAPVSLRSHNIESEIWSKLAQNSKTGLKKLYLKKMANQMKHYESQQFKRYDLIVPISFSDEQSIKQISSSIPVCTIPSGFNFNNGLNEETGTEGIFFIGGLDWLPNQEGIQWFIEKVFPIVLKGKPELKLYIAGRNMPSWMEKYNNENIIVVGEVDDASEFMKKRSLMVVPLRSGSGMRIKIVEALAQRKLVVSTTLGAEGIPYVSGKHLILADEEDCFASAVIKCLNDHEFAENLRGNGFTFVRHNLDNKVLGRKLIDFYSDYL